MTLPGKYLNQTTDKQTNKFYMLNCLCAKLNKKVEMYFDNRLTQWKKLFKKYKEMCFHTQRIAYSGNL